MFFTWVGSRPFLQTLDEDKHSSLFRKFVNYGHKMFHNIGPGIKSLGYAISIKKNVLSFQIAAADNGCNIYCIIACENASLL
jgi:hypothetical protein